MTETTRDTRIHPTAIVAPGAEIGHGVEIGPYCVVSGDARIGDRTSLHAHAQILNRVTLGVENELFAGAVVGGTPQDRTFHGEDSEIVIGERNQFREYTTVHIGTNKGDMITRIGDDNLFMGGTHIAHDCQVGDFITLGNNCMIAGHVVLESYSQLAGGTGVHQWCTVGEYSYVGALARVAMDVPPYLIVEGRPGRVRGLNLVGLKRSGLDDDRLEALRTAYKVLFHSSETREAALRTIEASDFLTPEVQRLLTHLRRSDRGFRGRYLEGLKRGYEPLRDDDRHDEGHDEPPRLMY